MSKLIKKTAMARDLRKHSTDAELVLWSCLRNRRLNNLKFKRQYPIGPFVVDFVCIQKRLVLELDGSQHLEMQEYDKERTLFLNRQGFKVIRFWNNEILNQKEFVLDQILSVTT